MKTILLNNLGLKTIALVLALVSWLAIRETINFEISAADIPLQIQASPGWAVFHQSDNVVTVTFRGSQDDIRLMDYKQIKALIDLRTNAVAGAIEVAVTPRAIQGLQGVRAVRVHPERVRISLDHEMEKTVAVKGRVNGKPLAGEVADIICEPALVRVRGPAQQLQQTEWIYTEPVDVEGRIESFAKRARVLPPSDSWSPHIDPADVWVQVAIIEKTESLEWKDVPVAAVENPNAPLKVEISPARVNILITGTEEVLEKLKAVPPMALVDCIDLDSSLTYDLPVHIYLPPAYSATVAANPPFVHIVPGK